MLTIVLIGTGNIASHLLNAFQKANGILVKQVFGRNTKTLQKFSEQVKVTDKITEIVDADLYLIAVNDSAIEPVSKIIKNKKGIVAHTSGSISINAIKHDYSAVFYPLQTFTKDREIDFSEVPICIEANDEKTLVFLKSIALKLSNSVYEVSSDQRRKLHMAAVFANNFSNHLFYLAQKICEVEKLPFDLLKPLIFETANKLQDLNSKDAQTGPARRNDIETMQKHLEELKDPIHKKLYQLLSESIKTTYEKEL